MSWLTTVFFFFFFFFWNANSELSSRSAYLGEFDSTSEELELGLPAGTPILFYVEDATGEEGWSEVVSIACVSTCAVASNVLIVFEN